jgi:hypothetical protein
VVSAKKALQNKAESSSSSTHSSSDMGAERHTPVLQYHFNWLSRPYATSIQSLTTSHSTSPRQHATWFSEYSSTSISSRLTPTVARSRPS